MSKPPTFSAPSNEAQPKAREDYRRRLLDGLAASIRERGLQQTQVGDIVRNARTSNRTFYECFPDKETCFAELVEEWAGEIVDTVTAAIDPAALWEHQLDQGIETLLGVLADDPAMTVTVTRDLPTLGARGIQIQEEDIDRYVDLLMTLTRGPAMRQQGIEPLSREVALMLVAGATEVVNRTIREGRPLDSVAPAVKRIFKLVVGSG